MNCTLPTRSPGFYIIPSATDTYSCFTAGQTLQDLVATIFAIPHAIDFFTIYNPPSCCFSVFLPKTPSDISTPGSSQLQSQGRSNSVSLASRARNGGASLRHNRPSSCSPCLMIPTHA